MVKHVNQTQNVDIMVTAMPGVIPLMAAGTTAALASVVIIVIPVMTGAYQAKPGATARGNFYHTLT